MFFLFSITGTIISIAFFNFAGVSVTKQISATTRTVLDSIRTIVIKIAGVALGWEKVDGIQLGGFALLLIGMFLYNDVLIRPAYLKLRGQRNRTNYEESDKNNEENREYTEPIMQ